MGKRQIGELQPSELVTTILISELAAVPMQNFGAPVIAGIGPIFGLVLLEILISVLALKLPFVRRAVTGRPVIIITDGVIDQRAIRSLRLSVPEVIEALRGMDVFDVAEVSYAIVETNGKLSVLKKPEKQNVTAEMLNLKPADNGLTVTTVADGKVQTSALYLCALDEKKLHRLLKGKALTPEQLFLMTADKAGNYNFIVKE